MWKEPVCTGASHTSEAPVQRLYEMENGATMNDFAGQSEVLAGQLRENIAFEKTGITKERKFRLVESLAFGYPHAHQLQRTNEISRLKKTVFCRRHFRDKLRLDRDRRTSAVSSI